MLGWHIKNTIDFPWYLDTYVHGRANSHISYYCNYFLLFTLVCSNKWWEILEINLVELNCLLCYSSAHNLSSTATILFVNRADYAAGVPPK